MGKTYILTANIETEVSDCENEHEAIETLDYLANRSVGTAKEEIREGLEDFFIDNGLMSEEEFKQEVENE